MLPDDLLTSSPILTGLNSTALAYGPCEGNLLYAHPLSRLTDSLDSDFKEKRYNLYTLAAGKKRIMEIGFNAGHSVLLMLLANPTAKYVLFDLGFHRYTDPAFQFLKHLFPKLEIIYGDSRVTVPLYDGPPFDLIHIDGSHELPFALRDYQSARRLSTSDTIIVADDTTPGNHLDVIFREEAAAGRISFLDREKLGLKPTPLHMLFTFNKE